MAASAANARKQRIGKSTHTVKLLHSYFQIYVAMFQVLINYSRIEGCLFANDIKMYIGICLGVIPLTCKQYIINTSLVIKKKKSLL